MCGILALFNCGSNEAELAIPLQAKQVLTRRGPDSQGEIAVELDHGSHVLLAGFVLHMQDLALQPIVDAISGDVLCFNGELYDVEGEEEEEKSASLSDTRRFLTLLSSCASNEERVRVLDDETLMEEGEWSFLFYSKRDRTVLFGRDRFGRRSLVEGRCHRQIACVSSVPFKDKSLQDVEWSEVPVASMFVASGSSDGIQVEALPRKPILYRHLAGNGSSENGDALETWQRVLKALEVAVRRRIHAHTLGNTIMGSHRRFAVLFSGGIDSVLIASLAHRVCADDNMTIPLINVSFQGEFAPDRIAAREALQELIALYPTRQWEFVAVDPSVAQVQEDHSLIQTHIAPKSSVMDFNLGCVLWFASRHAPEDCRALLTGLGADELSGGYGRHRTASQKGGEEALKKELELDLGRMWTRNLGRDDRCIAAHGKELRIPFLDRDVVRTIFESPLKDLVDFSSTNGDKLVIRKLMKELGFHASATREKRAAQFGSRMAKLVRSGRSGKDDFDVSALIASEAELATVQRVAIGTRGNHEED